MDTAYNTVPWSTFFSALVSAGAALTGLLFVSISINLQRILGAPQLVARAAKALATAMLLPVVSMFCLAPSQPTRWVGWELLVVGAVGGVSVFFLYWRSTWRNPFIKAWQQAVQMTVMLLSTMPFAVAGLSLLARRGGGLYWVLGGAVAALLAPVIDAWVLLVEIQR